MMNFYCCATFACFAACTLFNTANGDEPKPQLSRAEFKAAVIKAVNGAARGSQPFELTAQRIANGIGDFVKDVEDQKLGTEALINLAHERVHALIESSVKKRPRAWLNAFDDVIDLIRKDLAKEKGDKTKRVRTLLRGAVADALVEIGRAKSENQIAIAAPVKEKIDLAFQQLTPEQRKKFADTLASRFRKIDRESEDYATPSRAISHIRAEVEKIVQKVTIDDPMKRVEFDKNTTVVLDLVSANGSQTVADLLQAIHDSVIVAIAPYGSPPKAGSLGLTEFVVEEASRLRAYLELDVNRDKSAIAIAKIYEQASVDVTGIEPPKTPMIFVADTKQKVDAALAEVNRTAKSAGVADENLPWKALRNSIGLQLTLLEKQDQFNRRDKIAWQKAFHELAEGFKELAPKFKAGTDGGGAVAGRRGGASGGTGAETLTSPFGGFSGLSGSAYELEAKLELRRKAYKLHRKIVEEEFEQRQRLAKQSSECRRKLGEQRLEQAARDYRSQLRGVLGD